MKQWKSTLKIEAKKNNNSEQRLAFFLTISGDRDGNPYGKRSVTSRFSGFPYNKKCSASLNIFYLKIPIFSKKYKNIFTYKQL